MKKIQFTAAILMLALASSCSKTEEFDSPVIENEQVVVYATSESSQTRTALSGEGYTDVVWESGDAMNFYPVVLTDGVISSKLPGDAALQMGTKLTTTGSGSSAYFKASDSTVDLTQATASDNSSVAATNYFALTPYLDNGGTAAANVKLNNADGATRGTIYFRMPNAQTYYENTYDPAVAFAFAKSEDINALTFYNQFGVLRLNITGADTQKIKSIEVTANNDAEGATRYLSGFINACTKAEFDEGKTLSVSGTEGTTKFQSITMSCGDGVALSSEATAFNIVLIPFTGVTVTITYDDNGTETTIEKVTNSAIARSGLTNMATISLSGDVSTDPDNGSTESLDKTDGTWDE